MKHRLLVWLLSVLVATATMSAQQAYVLKGVVQDEAGEPLIGATFQLKGTSNGGATDIDGNFSINVKEGDVVTFSYVGYIPQEITVSGGNNLTIVLKENSEVLEDVVVIGYGTMRKKDLTGAVTQINPDKIADRTPAQFRAFSVAHLDFRLDMTLQPKDREPPSSFVEKTHSAPMSAL